MDGLLAILFLHDPSSNELWTQREDDAKVIQVPASLGLAGYALSNCSTVFVDDVSADQRFHAIVDQFMLSGLRYESHRHLSSSVGLSTGHKPKIALFSSALPSHDGNLSALYLKQHSISMLCLIMMLTKICCVCLGSVYGVLQIALPTSLLTDAEIAFATSQAKLFGKLCGLYGAFSHISTQC